MKNICVKLGDGAIPFTSDCLMLEVSASNEDFAFVLTIRNMVVFDIYFALLTNCDD
jgi:hypothetical protein